MNARGASSRPGFCFTRKYCVTMLSTLRCCRLYSWIRLTWMSNIQVGSSSTPVDPLTKSASRALLARLTSRHCWRNSGSSMNASSPRSRSRWVSHPSPICAVEQPAQARVGQREEATRCHPVGLVGEPLRPHLEEVLEDALLEQFRVQRGDAVDRVAADGGQIRHLHALAALFADDRHPPDPVLIAGELCPDLVEEPAVDLVDDLEVAG